MSEIKLVGIKVKPSMTEENGSWVAIERSMEEFINFIPCLVTLEQGESLVEIQTTLLRSNLNLVGVQDESDFAKLLDFELKLSKIERIAPGAEFVPYGSEDSVESEKGFIRCKNAYFTK